MILAVGFSYYNIINRIEDTSNDRIQVMGELAMDAADEELEITSVEITGINSLNLTIKNTGNEFSELEWVGVFDDTLGTQDYYRLDASLNPVETQKDIGNASIVMDPLNDYTIQVLTKLGNIYYGEYPEPPTGVTGGGGGNTTSNYYSEYTQTDLNPDTAVGTHSFFSAMKTGPDELINTVTEAVPVTGIANVTLVSESFEGVWIPTDWSDNPPGARWNQESTQVYNGVFSADFDGQAQGRSGDLLSPVMDCSDATTIYVEFWYYNQDLDPTEFVLEFWNGVGWVQIEDLSVNAQNTWLNYQIRTTDVQYQVADFQVQWLAVDLESNKHCYVDLVTITKASSGFPQYEFDMEVTWSGLPTKSNEYLSVYGGIQGAEALQVDVWDGGAWVNLIADVQTGWNNVDISAYLTGTSFNIRFKDSLQVGDVTQENWVIDALFLNLFD